jgi:hypothetical protein
MQDFRKLHAWQKSHALALRTYAITATFPKAELFGLISQMRRAETEAKALMNEVSDRKRQTADGRRQTVDGRRETVDGKQSGALPNVGGMIPLHPCLSEDYRL